MTKNKIGITENGDASQDYTWKTKADSMNMMVLITKHVTDEFIKRVLPYANKTIIHATCTGYGGTKVEPNVPEYHVQLEQVRKLIAYGFPSDQIVVRIDPIIPTVKGVALFESIVDEIYGDIKRFRISVIDNYPHVQQRFKDAGMPILFNGKFQASDAEFERVDNAISRLKFKYPDITIESCAEPLLKKTDKIGCISTKDMARFGLHPSRASAKKRTGCLCETKTELLPYNHVCYCTKKQTVVEHNDNCTECDKCKNCPHVQIYGCVNRCVYCYWKT